MSHIFMLVQHLLASALLTWWENPGCGGTTCTVYQVCQATTQEMRAVCFMFGLSFPQPHLCPSESLHSLLNICRKAKSFLLKKHGLVCSAAVLAMHCANSNENVMQCIVCHLQKTHTGSVKWFSHHFTYRQPIALNLLRRFRLFHLLIYIHIHLS